jgi:Trk K+ transport system NAD-binding subunit
MTTITDQDGYRFEIPDEEYTGTQLQEKARMERDAVPVIRRGDKDIPVEPDEVVKLQPEDRVIFTTPVESACYSVDLDYSKAKKGGK